MSGFFVDSQWREDVIYHLAMTSLTLKLCARKAAVVVAVFCAVGCEEKRHSADWWQGEQERLELTHRLELQQFRFEQAYSREFEEFQKLQRSTSATAGLLKSLRQQHLELSEDVESLQNHWAQFRESILRDQRQRAVGKVFETISLTSGKTYENVSVASIDDAGVTIRHADGSARLRFADLNAGQRLFFGLEADLALAAAEKESQDALAYEQWINERMVSIQQQKAEASALTRRDQVAAAELRESQASQLLAASSARALAQPARSVSGRSWSYYDSYPRYSRYTNYGSYVPSVRYGYYSQPNSTRCYTRQAVVEQMGNTFRQSFADTTIRNIP